MSEEERATTGERAHERLRVAPAGTGSNAAARDTWAPERPLARGDAASGGSRTSRTM